MGLLSERVGELTFQFKNTNIKQLISAKGTTKRVIVAMETIRINLANKFVILQGARQLVVDQTTRKFMLTVIF